MVMNREELLRQEATRSEALKREAAKMPEEARIAQERL